MVFEKGLEREYGILADPHFARKLIAREKSKENCPAVAELPKDIKNQLRGVIFKNRLSTALNDAILRDAANAPPPDDDMGWGLLNFLHGEERR
jgi:hypothetical protein